MSKTAMYPTIQLKGGPFDGQRRPIINGLAPDEIERLPQPGGLIECYVLQTNQWGEEFYVYKGPRKIGFKG